MPARRGRHASSKKSKTSPSSSSSSSSTAPRSYDEIQHQYHNTTDSNEELDFETEPDIPLFTAVMTFFGYGLLMVFGYIRDIFGYIFGRSGSISTVRSGYAPLLKDFEDFYTRRLYHRIKDCWNRPIASCPGAYIDVMERERVGHMSAPLELSGRIRKCLNLGSYNYLGFGDPNSPTREDVLQAIDQYGVSVCSETSQAGKTALHEELEALVARFVGKEEAMCFAMGFGTNSTGIPSLVGKGTLLLSDANNHASIVAGARASGAKVAIFKHNDPRDLERALREWIVNGQPRTHRPWRKIVVIVEGIYSMEGEMCPLREIVALKQKYKFYLFVDEAHSIGALGARGRGICEFMNVNPADIDILMGTFTKSFGGVGGYICSTSAVMKSIRQRSEGILYTPAISPPVAQQVISAMKIILGEDGTDIGANKINALRENANYFRAKCRDMGLHTLGHFGSPVAPIMLYNPAKIAAFSRECLKRNLAVVVVGFPASPLLLSRARFCISAAHNRADLDHGLAVISEVADLLGLKYTYAWSNKLNAFIGTGKSKEE